MSKTALITGATSGIGWATAEIFADNGVNLVVCGRRTERLEALKQQLSSKVKVQSLQFDVREKPAVKAVLDSINEDMKPIDILVNNAGNAHGMDTFDKGSLEDWDAMMDINVKGLLYVSRFVIPAMVRNGKGHVVNIGSIAGKETYPKGNVYCASKYAVDAINQSMRMDLFQHNIRVSAINPGLVETEFSDVRFKGDTERAKKVYEGFRPLVAKDIAEAIWFVVNAPEHVNIADMIILSTDQASSQLVNRKQVQV